MRGIIYRKAFGESCKYKNVVGEGFGIIDGKFKILSGAFNLAKGNDLYHDENVNMNPESAGCVGTVALAWQLHNFPRRQNYSVEELIALSKCTIL